MKKIKLVYLFFLFLNFLVSYGQEICGSHAYLNHLKSKYPSINSEIKTTISKIVERRKTEKSSSSNQIVTIPVVFNILHRGENIGLGRNISYSKIIDQINILNAAYSGQYGGVDTFIRFCLSQENATGVQEQGIFRFFGEEHYQPFKLDPIFNLIPQWDEDVDMDIKNNYNIGYPSNLYLRIWVLDLVDQNGNDGLLGYSSFPYVTDDIQETINGIVIDYEYFGNNSQTLSEGKNLVHEIGHWLGLFHTFKSDCDETNCDSQGDLICDTPKVPDDGTSNVAPLPSFCQGYDCNNNLTDAVRNYLDYQNPDRFNCRNAFTQGQADRMHDILMTYKYSIYSNQSAICGSYTGGNNGGGGVPDGFEECRNLGVEAQRAFKITDNNYENHGHFGRSLSIDDNRVAISDPSGHKIYFYDMGSDCGINPTPYVLSNTRNDLDEYFFGEKILLQNDKLLVATIEVGQNDYRRKVLFFEYINGSWLERQEIPLPDSYPDDTIFGKKMLMFEDELIIADDRSIFIYKYQNGRFENFQAFYLTNQGIPSNNTSIGDIKYNGQYLVVKRGGQYLDFFFKDSSGNFVQRQYDSNTQIDASGIAITDAPENKLYAFNREVFPSTTYHKLEVYDMNTFNQNSDIIEFIESKYIIAPASGHDVVRETLLYDNYLVINFIGNIWSYDLTSNDFDSIKPNDVDGPNDFRLYPSSIRGAEDIDINNNFLAVSTTGCREVFLYKYDNLFDLENLDRTICSPPSGDYISGYDITIGGSCNSEFNFISGPKVVNAKNSIVMKPGTHIKNGSTFVGSINDLCVFNGGVLVDSANSASLKTEFTQIDLPDDYNSSIVNSDSNDIMVYPNPTENTITISFTATNKPKVIELLNVSGQRLKIFSDVKTEMKINLSKYPPNVYILNCIFSDNKIISKKIVKK